MRKLLALVSLAALALSAAPKISPEAAGLDPAALAKIGATMEQKMSQGRTVGALGMIYRHGEVVYLDSWGHRDLESNLPMTPDSIVRMYSMSKPITSVGVMMLVEEGKLSLDDPASKYIPELGNLEVLVDGKRVPSKRDMTIKDLLTHTSGLTYGFFADHPVDKLYREAETHKTKDLAELMTALGKLPLKYHPGEKWNYSYSTDVLGRVIEVVSGQPLDEYLQVHIFKLLKMKDTGFSIRKKSHDLIAKIYTPDENDSLVFATDELVASGGRRIRNFRRPTAFFSGGGGLAASANDYIRFAEIFLNGGGGLITQATIDLMMQNHQPEPTPTFGLGMGINDAPDGKSKLYGWGGAAGTRFWVDPGRDMITVFETQLYPGGGKRKSELQKEFLKLVYDSLTD